MSKPEMTHAPTKHVLVTLPADALSFNSHCGKGIWKHLLVSLYDEQELISFRLCFMVFMIEYLILVMASAQA
jgi:hypothetical protein